MHSAVPFLCRLHLKISQAALHVDSASELRNLMAEKISIPNQLPILPVRDTVLFPGAVLPLTVGRESSLALVNSLSGDDKLLGVVAQLDPRIEDPAAADLHKVGTLAKV